MDNQLTGPAVVTSSSVLSWTDIPRGAGTFFGKRLLLRTSDPALFIAAVAALEGSAQSICVLPPCLADNERRLMVGDENQFDVVISETSQRPAAIRTLADLRSTIDGHQAVSSVSGHPTEWTIPTSGTTGVPKLVDHSWKSLTTAIRENKRKSTSDERWGLLYGHSRFAGLQVILQALVHQKTLLAPTAALPLKERVAFLAQNRCSHLSTTPTSWRKILMLEEASGLQLQQITLGGEAADEQILNALAARFPQARITHIYASTEAGVGFSTSDRRPGFPVSYLDRPAYNQVQLKVSDNRLYLKNPDLVGRYASGETFIADGWIDTGDLVDIVGDRVIVTGRANGLINVGGDKVMPSQVRDVLLSCDPVIDARIYAKPNPITGNIVAADVVVDPISEQGQPNELRHEILRYSREHLASFQVPRFMQFVPEIAVNETGKARI